MKIKPQLFFLLLFVILRFESVAQNKPITYLQQSWAGWYPQVKFSKHWGSWYELEVHSADHYFNGVSQAIVRLAATYYTNSGSKFTAGYGFTDYFPGDNHLYFSLPEHHAWEQYQWFNDGQKHKLMQWLRLEQKFKENVIDNYTADNSFTITYKLRYNIFYLLPLTQRGFNAGSISLGLGNEIYFYYGPHISNHVFDQNRVSIGLSYAVNTHDNIVIGITNILQESGDGNSYLNTNLLRLSFFQNIQWH